MLGGICGSDKVEGWDEDVMALEVTLLALYQQDFNISPLPKTIRVASLSKSSIYHVIAF